MTNTFGTLDKYKTLSNFFARFLQPFLPPTARVTKIYSQFQQIQLSILRNTTLNIDKYIWQFGQIQNSFSFLHQVLAALPVCDSSGYKKLFFNFNKYIWQIWQIKLSMFTNTMINLDKYKNFSTRFWQLFLPASDRSCYKNLFFKSTLFSSKNTNKTTNADKQKTNIVIIQEW